MQIIDLTADNTSAIRQAAAILNAAFREHWPTAWATMEEAIEDFNDLLAEGRICRVALDDVGVVIGIIGGIPEYDGNVWELHPLAVRPDLQGQRIGRALVVDFERQVAARGGLTIMLGADDEDDMTTLSSVDLYDNLWERVREIRNLRGHPYEFYQKLGYTIIGVVPDANGYGKPDIIMGKRVSP